MIFNELSRTVLWAIGGIVLITAEVVAGSFLFIFFGVAGLLVSVSRLVGLDNLPLEVILFVIVGMGSVSLLRKRVIAMLNRSPTSRKSVSSEKKKE